MNKEKKRRKLKWLFFDRNLVHFFSKRRKNSLTTFMRIMTKVGDGLIWFIFCVIFLAVDLYTGIALTITSVLQVLLQTIIKHIFVRQRPYVRFNEISMVVSPPDKFSFPSGHTAGAFTIAFVLYYFCPIFFIPMLILAVCIAFSRIYLGLHYPSDIIAGIILGFVSALISIYLTFKIEMLIEL